MAFKDIWKDKVDGVDDVLAEDINSIAQATIDNEEDIKHLREDLDNLDVGGEVDLGNYYTKVEVDEQRGNLADLTTTDKTNLVAAINEVDEQIGDIETALDGIITIQNQLMGVSE